MRKHWYTHTKNLVIVATKTISCTEQTANLFREEMLECFKDGWFAKGEIEISRDSNNVRRFRQVLVRYDYE